MSPSCFKTTNRLTEGSNMNQFKEKIYIYLNRKHKMIWIFERVIVIWSFWIISLSVLTTVWGDETLANANEKTSSRAGIKALVAPAREMVSDVPNCKLTFCFLRWLAWQSAARKKLIWFSVLTCEQNQISDQSSDKDGSKLVCSLWEFSNCNSVSQYCWLNGNYAFWTRFPYSCEQCDA